MTSSTHHIQITRYNRRLQFTPKERVTQRNKEWLKHLQGKVTYGNQVTDTKSSSERRTINQRLGTVQLRDRMISGIVALIIILTTYFTYMAFF